MPEDGTYHLLGRDPITQVFGKEHGGRTKGVSTTVGVRKSLGWVKGNRERHEVVDIEAIKEKVTESVTAVFQEKFQSQENKLQRQEVEMAALKAIVAQIQGSSSSCASDGSHDAFDELEDPIPCDLLWPYPGPDHRVAIGKVYPTRDATLHRSCISEGYIKVQVDTVIDGYKAIPVPKPTQKVSLLEHTILEFIEWPRKNSPNNITNHHATLSAALPLVQLCHAKPRLEELESQVALLPQSGYPPTSWPEMAEQPMSSHHVASEPAEPKQTQEERVKERLNKLKHQPEALRDSAKRFTKCEKVLVSVVPPHEMYDKPREEWIEYEAILDLHINAKVDITFVHWWAMCLYSMAKKLGDNKCAFLNPHLITSSECRKNDKDVIEHIMITKRLNPGKEIYMAPYMQADAHWVLIVLCPNSRKGYILDLYKYEEKNENSYYFLGIVERAFDTIFDWMMVKVGWDCRGSLPLQRVGFRCSMSAALLLVGCLWDDSRRLTLLEIEQVALLTLNEFYKAAVVPFFNS
ncbi:ulp1 protease family, C-terminal catalytic domain-containing protein [Tanacetum coccineum]